MGSIPHRGKQSETKHAAIVSSDKIHIFLDEALIDVVTDVCLYTAQS